jgi:hypothetical protein
VRRLVVSIEKMTTLVNPKRVHVDRDHAIERDMSKLNEGFAPNIGVSTQQGFWFSPKVQ